MLPAWCGLSGLDEAETGCGLMLGGGTVCSVAGRRLALQENFSL